MKNKSTAAPSPLHPSPEIGNGLFQFIGMEWSTGQKRVFPAKGKEKY